MMNEMISAHFEDCARRAERSGRIAYTGFLDPAQQELAQRTANAAHIAIQFNGGYADAERQLAAFGAAVAADDDDEGEPYWPLRALYVRWDKRFATVAHRDLLGALMGLGIERESFGDIVVCPEAGYAVVFVLDDMADYLIANWESAGRTSITVRDLPEEVELPPPRGDTFRITVASLRLDAVLAGIFKLSRNEAANVIRQGRVRVNFIERDGIDWVLQPGDLVSARGIGRARVLEHQGETRKGRIGLSVFQYSNK